MGSPTPPPPPSTIWHRARNRIFPLTMVKNQMCTFGQHHAPSYTVVEMPCFADPGKAIKCPETSPEADSNHAGKREVVVPPGFQISSSDPVRPATTEDAGLPRAFPGVGHASSSVLNTILSSKKVMYCCGQSALSADESMKLSSVHVAPSASTAFLFRSG